jgi:uncharacterized membrane protein YgcG
VRRILLLLLLATPALGKSLHWTAVDVEARLDRDGNLHVVERQQMVFDGDWNGGERDFNVRGRQQVGVRRIVRVDDGREIPLTQGPLDEIDRWDFASAGVVRWRSRLPGDPPFEKRELTYVLDSVYRNILVAGEGKQFRLSHDFGLPEREGTIERFTLRLTVDPIWGNDEPLVISRTSLPPREGVPVERVLTYGGAGYPAGVERPMPWWIPALVLLLFGAGSTYLVRRFLAAERETGRFAPVEPRLDEAVLKLAPEVAGAVWDAGVGAPEVAAVLARLTQEGKITARTEDDTLHMHLNLSRQQLTGYDGELVAKLFFNGRKNTDTDSIRDHYRKSGFDPSKIIREGIELKLDKLAHWSTKVTRFNGGVNALLLTAAALALAGSAFMGESDVFAAVFGAVSVALFSIFACIAAVYFSKAIDNVPAAMIAPFILLCAGAAPLVVASLIARAVGLHAPVLFALLFWTLAFQKLALDLLKIRDKPEKIVYRKRIAGARRYFIEQLALPQPALRDEWFPYVLAFGLGATVDRWFRSFGGETRSAAFSGSSISSSSSSSSSSSGWTGGGGAFGGAGASGTWAVAAGTMAAGVAAPSSSGSGGGGGGGGSSSGGGGGGGW